MVPLFLLSERAPLPPPFHFPPKSTEQSPRCIPIDIPALSAIWRRTDHESICQNPLEPAAVQSKTHTDPARVKPAPSVSIWLTGLFLAPASKSCGEAELELELIQSHMSQILPRPPTRQRGGGSNLGALDATLY